MKKMSTLFCAGVLMSTLCAAFVACNNEPTDPDTTTPWLGQEIPGMKTHQATGTIIGSYSNGFGSMLVQVDEEYPIGKTIEPVEYKRLYTSLPDDGTCRNMIQVQYNLPVEMRSKISFSFREYQAEKDFYSLFAINGGVQHAFGEPEPDVPIYVITKYTTITE